MIYRTWDRVGGADLLQVVAAGRPASDVASESRTAIATAIDELHRAGYRDGQIVRSRLWARDAEMRRIASDVRIAELSGQRRGASASFIDSERLPDGSKMMIELFALHADAPEGEKIVQEYDPAIAPPMFVQLDGIAFLSGNTDVSPTFADQLVEIRRKIDAGLSVAGRDWEDVVALSAFVAKSLGPATVRAALAKTFGAADCPFRLTTVAGFSAPEKLIEIEVTAGRR